jgi:hypothetical protein
VLGDARNSRKEATATGPSVLKTSITLLAHHSEDIHAPVWYQCTDADNGVRRVLRYCLVQIIHTLPQTPRVLPTILLHKREGKRAREAGRTARATGFGAAATLDAMSRAEAMTREKSFMAVLVWLRSFVR